MNFFLTCLHVLQKKLHANNNSLLQLSCINEHKNVQARLVQDLNKNGIVLNVLKNVSYMHGKNCLGIFNFTILGNIPLIKTIDDLKSTFVSQVSQLGYVRKVTRCALLIDNFNYVYAVY